VSSNAGKLSIFFPRPFDDGFVEDSEGAGDAPDAHAVLAGPHHLFLEGLIVAWPRWLQDKRALAFQTLGSLRAVLGVAVLAEALAPAARANMDNRRRKHPKSSPMNVTAATARIALPSRL
jgi:hypothetical protein